MPKGFIHVYTGEGKGKTTAALGLALRAQGAGLRVYLGQFMKKGEYNELKALRQLKPQLKIEQFGRRRRVGAKLTVQDKTAAERGFLQIKKILNNNRYDLVILDEINLALHHRLLSCEKLVDLLKNRPTNIEVVLTGRHVPAEIIKIADLVTEMKLCKHYYAQGVLARDGIEK